MKKVRIMLAMLLAVALVGGTYANYASRSTVRIFFKENETDQCDNSILTVTAKTVTTGLPAGYQTLTLAKITTSQPAATECNAPVYYVPEG
ncbi:MAG: hypothetical protein DI539_16575 [Flavobacterium psychrophilum]|nr:MAG: hypothetical protein DI539_16575 [Flavobacterium psychrophilum]